MGRWIKFFTDGSLENGSDEKIREGKASWSKGRLTDIKEVSLLNLNYMGTLTVPDTEWHQFDRLMVPVSEGIHVPQYIYRVVQAEIQAQHIGMYINFFRESDEIIYCCRLSHGCSYTNQILDSHVGKWISFVLPASNPPYVCVSSTKGSISNDDWKISK
jgi:hypothetical protein